MNLTNFVAFFASLGVGCGVLYANPQRAINRAFFLASVNVAAWQMSLESVNNSATADPALWIRNTSAIGALFPFLLWIIKDCAKGEEFGWGSLRRGWAWLALALLMAALCLSHYFIPSESTRYHPLRGIGWSVYAIVNGAAYVILFVQALSDLQLLSGIQKIEMQTLLIGGASAGLVAVILTTLGPILDIPALPRSLSVVIVAFYSFTAWGITTQKVFDARDLFRTALRFGLSIGVVSVVIGAAIEISPLYVPRPVVAVGCAVLITLAFNQFNRRLLRATQLGGGRDAEMIQAAILAAGRDEVDHDILVRRFGGILAAWSRCNQAFFMTAEREAYSGGKVLLPFYVPAALEILSLKWATPESLQRRRDASGRRELAAFMSEHKLGVLVCAPSIDDKAPFIVALGLRRDRTPITWSEIKQLQEWVGIIEHTLSRISLTQQARESEQLRTAGLLGASLAHEIRNPLVTIKTIAQSAKTRFHDPEFRRLLIELVPAEIERIEGLVTGLMDLGRPQHPHFEHTSLNEIVEGSVKLVRPKALDEAVILTCELEANPDSINADRGSIRQIMLNLVMNAIQAVSAMEGKREVRVRTYSGTSSVVLEVSDNGPGMPEEVLGRLFQPFTTSNKTSGIGLGLAITADLVKLHQGQIYLVEGVSVGTTFRVTLPCQQLSY